MGRKLSIGGTDNLAHKGKKMWVGNGVALKGKKAWIGDENGIARLFFSGANKAMIITSCRLGNSSAWTRNIITTDDMNKFDTTTSSKGYDITSSSYMDVVPAFDKLFVPLGCTDASTSNLAYTEDYGKTWIDAGVTSHGNYLRKRLKLLNNKLCFVNQNGFNIMDSDLTITIKEIYTSDENETVVDICYMNGYYYYVTHKSDVMRLYRASESDTKFSIVTGSYVEVGTLLSISLNVVGGLLVIIADTYYSSTKYKRYVYTSDGTKPVRHFYDTLPQYYGAGYVYTSDDNTLHTIHPSENKEVVRSTYVVQDGVVTRTESQQVIATLPFSPLYYPVLNYFDGKLICLYRDVEYGNTPTLWCAVQEGDEWVTQKILELTTAEQDTCPLEYTFFNGGEPNGYYYLTTTVTSKIGKYTS